MNMPGKACPFSVVSNGLENKGMTALQSGQSYKDPNVAAHHFHGHYGNPGTNNVPCDPLPPAGVSCYRGDNIFADIMPGRCNEYQYDISRVTAPGTFW